MLGVELEVRVIYCIMTTWTMTGGNIWVGCLNIATPTFMAVVRGMVNAAWITLMTTHSSLICKVPVAMIALLPSSPAILDRLAVIQMLHASESFHCKGTWQNFW